MKTLYLLVVFFSLSAFTPPSNIETIVYDGIAKDMVSQQVIYRESHNEIYAQKNHVKSETRFFDGNNNLIAKRDLDFSKSKTKPQYSLYDYRTGWKESVVNKNGVYTIEYRENHNSKPIVKTLEVPEPAVVDGGFNYFVKTEWDNLMKGETLVFNFISTARQDYYRFQLTKTAEETVGNSNEVIIKMEPANYLLRTLLDPILITYNIETKRIINYIGISNIKDNQGENYFATLTYPTVGP